MSGNNTPLDYTGDIATVLSRAYERAKYIDSIESRAHIRAAIRRIEDSFEEIDAILEGFGKP